MSTSDHPNLSLLSKLDLQDLDACSGMIAENFVWHYINPHLPGLHGDYRGIDGWKDFFAKLGTQSRGSFQRRVVNGWTAGDEFVVTQVCNTMSMDGRSFEVDAVVLWRIVAGKIAEAWDIPAVNTVRPR